MSKDYRVRIAYGFYRVGQIIQPQGVLRSELLARGLIEPVPEVAPLVAGPEPEAEVITEQPRRKNKRPNAIHGN